MLLAIALTGVVILFLLEKFFPIVIDNFIMRLTVADITSGRKELFRLYHDFILKNPRVLFFGVGVMEFSKQVVGEYAVAANLPHNGIQEIVIAWGAPGFVMFTSYLMTMVLQSARYHMKRFLISYIPLLLVLLKAQAGQMITSDYTMMALVFCYLSMTQKFEKE
jgi:hypothetical protein